MSNDYDSYPSDSPEKMTLFATQHDFLFPYLVDQGQLIARSFNAVCTPDFFGFNKNRELQYHGRLDDDKMADDNQRSPELLNAMQLTAKRAQVQSSNKQA